MKFEVIEWTWSLMLIDFSISFPNMLRRIIDQDVLGILYNGLLGFGIIIDVDFLKYDS